jgi:hypothetical protein
VSFGRPLHRGASVDDRLDLPRLAERLDLEEVREEAEFGRDDRFQGRSLRVVRPEFCPGDFTALLSIGDESTPLGAGFIGRSDI